MMKMKKVLLAGVSAILLGGVMVRPASAQIATVCATCTQESTEAMRWVTQLERMASELQSLRSEVTADVSQISNLRNIGNGFSNGNFGDLTSRLSTGAYSLQQITSAPTMLQNDYSNLGTQYKNLTNTLNTRSSQIATDSQTISTLQATSDTSVGTHGAMMVSNQIQAQRAVQELNAEQAQTQALSTIAAASQVESERNALSNAEHASLASDPSTITVPTGD